MPKRHDFAVDLSAVDHGQFHERSPADGDWLSAHDIVHNLVTIQKPNRIRLRFSVVEIADDTGFIVEPVLAQLFVVLDGDELRFIDGRSESISPH